MRRKLLHLFLLLQFVFANSVFSQTEIKNPNEENYLQFKILESEQETGKYITGDIDKLGFTEYAGKQTLAALAPQNRMITLRSDFSIEPALNEEEWVIVIPPIFYACNIYLNGHLIARRGDIKKGYTSRSHYTISILLLPELLNTNPRNNSLAIELLPKYGEKNSVNGIFISSRQTGETYVFWRNLFSVDFIRAMALVSFVIFLYFFIFSFRRKTKRTSYYIPFSLICLTYPLAYLNNIITYNFCDTLLLEKLSRLGVAFWSLLTPIYVLEFTKVFKNYKKRINIALATIYLPFFVLGWLPDTVLGVIGFGVKYTSVLVLCTGIFTILICLIFAFKTRTKYATILSSLYLLTIPSGAHDIYYFAVLQSKPYVLLTPYIMFLVVIVFFFIVSWQQSEVYKLALDQSNELKHVNENLEQIIKERTENLRMSEERLSLALLATSDGLWDWNLETDTVYYSPAWKSMLGYPENELETSFSTFEKIVHHDDLERLNTYIKEFLDKKHHRYEIEFRMIHKNGSIINILSRAIKEFDNYTGKVQRLVGTHVNITERKKAEEQIFEQQKELEQEKRNAEEAKQETEKLNEFTRIINSNSNIANILKEIYAYLRKETGYEIVWILLVNKKQDKLFSAENLSVFETQIEFDREFFLNFRMKLTESLGILYHTYKERIPFYCPDITLSKRNITNHFNGKQHKLHQTDFKIQRKGFLKSMLQFPLLLHNEVIGIINLTAHTKKVEISPTGINKVTRFADQIAGVIRNAHLLEEAEEAKKEAEMEQRIAEFARLETEKEKEKSEKLLLRILPEKIAKELKETGSAKPSFYESVSVMFTDFKGFTKIAEKLSPNELITELDGCFSYFDSLVERYNLEKLKTIGDSYMCAGGIPVVNKTHPIDSVLAALEIQAVMNQVKELKEGLGHPYWELRLGIHTGPLVAGVIGEKKFAYDVWGDTVNTASRMESSGTAGMVNISSDTYELVKEFFDCVYRGKIQAKNKGEVDMYYVTGIKKELSVNNDCKTPSYKFWMLHDRVKNGEKINKGDLKDRRIAQIEI